MNKGNASLTFIFITILVDVIGFGIIIPVLPSLIESLQGEGLSEAARVGGWLILAYAGMQFLFSPILGELSDRFGRRPILLLSLLGLGVDYILHAYAPSLFWLFIGRILAGMCGASFTVATAYIADISTPEKKAQNFGMIGAAFGLGFIIGPAIGGFAAEWGVRVPFLLAAGLTLLNFLYGVFILPESHPKENRRAFDPKNIIPGATLIYLRRYPIVAGLIISFFLLYLAGHSVQSTWTFFTMFKFDWDEKAVGLSLAVVGIVVALVQGLLVRFAVKWWGDKKTIYIGYVLWIIGLILFGIASQGWMLYLFLVPYCLGGIASPSLQSVVSNEVPNNEQGELQGALTSLISLTAIIGPVLMTNIFHYFTKSDAVVLFPGSPFIAGAILILVSLLLSIRPLRMLKGK